MSNLIDLFNGYADSMEEAKRTIGRLSETITGQVGEIELLRAQVVELQAKVVEYETVLDSLRCEIDGLRFINSAPKGNGRD